MRVRVESTAGAQAQINGTSPSSRLEQHHGRFSASVIVAHVALSLLSIGLLFESFLDVSRIHTFRLDCKVHRVETEGGHVVPLFGSAGASYRRVACGRRVITVVKPDGSSSKQRTTGVFGLGHLEILADRPDE